MRKIFVTGYKGYIGSKLIEMGCKPLDCNVTNPIEVRAAIRHTCPEIIIHLAGKSDVNYCESDDGKETAMRTNYGGSVNVFRGAEWGNSKVVYVSSDHIFSGGLFGGRYSEKSKPSPINYYGMTKLAVEQAASVFDCVSVVRTSTLFSNNRSMIERLMERIRLGSDVPVPTFLRRTYMHRDHFCKSLLDYCDNLDTMPKVLNISGSKYVTFYQFISDYAKHFGLDYRKVKKQAKDYTDVGFAIRPHRAGLDTTLSKDLYFKQYSYLDGIKLNV